ADRRGPATHHRSAAAILVRGKRRFEHGRSFHDRQQWRAYSNPEFAIPSLGPNPASLGYNPNLNIMTVVNRNTDPNQPVRRNSPNYTTFTVSSSGALIPTGNSVALSDLNAMPSQALVQPANNLVFTLEYETALISSYRLGATGSLTKVSQLGPPAAGMNPLGEARHPSQNVLYVGYPTSSVFGVYTFDNTGKLTFVKTVGTG